eukprot:TRINITY_DN1220_c0_g1_i2.p1 TRINITY_DN1220_c0_g1~~TRINITY_DN1220_c0_g1_i2.p1  ORF type:complete len:521 (+),score=58.20 TRINITY_DN1220_c0_g1_i2:1161-2723(+)
MLNLDIWNSKRAYLFKKKKTYIGEQSKLCSEIKKINSTISNEKLKQSNLENQLAQLLKELKNESVSSLDQQLNHESNCLKQKLALLNQTVIEIDSIIISIQNQIMETGGNDIVLAEKNLERMNDEIENTNNEISQLVIQKKKITRKISRLEQIEIKLSNESLSLTSNLMKMSQKCKDLELKSINQMDTLEILEGIHTQCDDEVQALKMQLSQSQHDLIQLDNTKIEVDGKLNDSNSLLEKCLSKQNEFQRLCEAFCNKAIYDTFCLFQSQAYEVNQECKKCSRDMLDCLPEKRHLLQRFFERTDTMSSDTLLSQITLLENKMYHLTSNFTVIQHYRDKMASYRQKKNNLDILTMERNKAISEFESLRRKRLEMFLKGFNVISTHLKEIYQMITLGGDAELELVDSLDPFSEGVLFSVRPPQKSWKNIGNLSGGEKTLSSLSLIFALHHYKPTPLYVMDEIDAALDYKNVSIVANYIKDKTTDAQFVIISLRNNMFELANSLIGVFKNNNASDSVSLLSLY